jgi:hypothetical protein
MFLLLLYHSNNDNDDDDDDDDVLTHSLTHSHSLTLDLGKTSVFNRQRVYNR